jgi:hypothetical protein
VNGIGEDVNDEVGVDQELERGKVVPSKIGYLTMTDLNVCLEENSQENVINKCAWADNSVQLCLWGLIHNAHFGKILFCKILPWLP